MGKELVFIPLGGTGEIGMNCNLYGYGSPKHQDWIMIDLGITFPRQDLPGVDVITPDIGFIAAQRERLHGLILTHGHEDHIGAVALLWPYLQVPIYTTPFTAALVHGKLAERGLDDVAQINIIDPSKPLNLGPFRMDFINLTHSIAEMQAVVLRVEGHCLLHTGDWKIDPSPVIGPASGVQQLKELGVAGVDAIICDSTNVLSPGRSGSEASVAEEITDLIAAQEGRVVVTTFASNVARLASIGAAARATGRHVTLAGRGMYKVFKAAIEAGYLDDFPNVVSEEDAGYLPPEKQLILCTGSQGEPRAALARLADNAHPHLSIGAGDTVIFSSKMIPGNEIEILDLQNRLIRQGVTVLTTADADIHVSGHPCQDELRDMYKWVKPRVSIPVHGESRHLVAHAALAGELGVETALIIQNGDVVQFSDHSAAVIDQVPAGRLYLDGQLLVNKEAGSVSARRKLSHVGVVSVALAVDSAGRLVGQPEIAIEGLPELDDDGIRLSDWVREAIDLSLPDSGRVTPTKVEADIKQRIRKTLARIWGKKPIVQVMIVAL